MKFEKRQGLNISQTVITATLSYCVDDVFETFPLFLAEKSPRAPFPAGIRNNVNEHTAVLMIEVNKLSFFFLVAVFSKEIENMFSARCSYRVKETLMKV